MKLSAFKQHLGTVANLQFRLPGGTYVPAHFHITEAGLTTKHFIDCGGTERTEKNISFQLWVATDTHHRLSPEKLMGIIRTYEKMMGHEDLEVETEYQTDTISRYALDFDGTDFILVPKFTDCLAKDHCGIPAEKKKISLSELSTTEKSSCCAPGGGCC